jgi:hypothetical protein
MQGLRICYLKRSIEFQPLTFVGRELEMVQSHKALGLTIQNNLKWEEHIRSIIAKGFKRLHILRNLRRSGILSADLIKRYSALIRSILEYSCEVWSISLLQYADDLERLQKRVMRITFPGHPYDEALVMAGCKRLDNRRNTIYIKTLNKIIKHGPLKEHVLQTRATAHQYNTRNSNDLSLYKCRTERFKNSFFLSTIAK